MKIRVRDNNAWYYIKIIVRGRIRNQRKWGINTYYMNLIGLVSLCFVHLILMIIQESYESSPVYSPCSHDQHTLTNEEVNCEHLVYHLDGSM